MRSRAHVSRGLILSLFLALLVVILHLTTINPQKWLDDQGLSTPDANQTNASQEVGLLQPYAAALRSPHNATIYSTAFVLRTMAPLHPHVLHRVYELSSLLKDDPLYDFWLLLDVTATNDKSNETEELLVAYFQKHGKENIQPPPIFPVSESTLWTHYPNLTSYAFNEPIANVDNQTGLCCSRTIMWQMFIPNSAIFLRSLSHYPLAWFFEDDVNVHGQYGSVYEVVRLLDSLLDPQVDLAAPLYPRGAWGGKKHTAAMEDLVQEMRKAKLPWRLYSDALQRHSRDFSQSVYHEVGRNVMSFGERVVAPIAWKHGHLVADLSAVVAKNNVPLYGLNELTGTKKTNSQGILRLLQTPNHTKTNNNTYPTASSRSSASTPATFIFHEEIARDVSPLSIDHQTMISYERRIHQLEYCLVVLPLFYIAVFTCTLRMKKRFAGC